jgi:hypothetical protein
VSARRRPPWDVVLPLLAWGSLIVAARLLVLPLQRDDPRVGLNNPPLLGHFHIHPHWQILPALVLGGLGVAYGPELAERLRWRTLLAASWLGTLAWIALLAASDGPKAITRPLLTRYEFLAEVPRVSATHDFLGTFTAIAPTYDFHVHSHPPGMLLVLWALDKVGLGGGVIAAAVIIGAGALIAPAALVAARELGTEAWARAAAPFLVFVPAAVWMGTSPDALYAGVSASGIALFALATGRRDDALGDALAVAGGVLLGAGLFLTYGLVTLGAVPLTIALARRRLRPLLLAGAGALAVVLAFLLGGFWWFDGLDTSRELQLSGVFRHRPYAQFLVNSPAAFAFAVGPAAAVALVRLRERGVWILTGAALLALAIADLSGYARGETERVWLPFVPWILVSAAALSRDVPGRRRWLALQVATGLALQVATKSPW